VHLVFEGRRGGDTFPVPSGRAAVNGLVDPDRLDLRWNDGPLDLGVVYDIWVEFIKVALGFLEELWIRLIFSFSFRASELDGLALREVCTAHKVVGVRSDEVSGWLA